MTSSWFAVFLLFSISFSRDYHWTYNLKCVNIDELRALEPDFTAWEGVDDDDVMDIFLQSQSISIPGGFGRLPAINGVRNKWPVYPSQVTGMTSW